MYKLLNSYFHSLWYRDKEADKKRKEILKEASNALELINQLPEDEKEKKRMATEINRHLSVLNVKKSYIDLYLDAMPYFVAFAAISVFLTVLAALAGASLIIPLVLSIIAGVFLIIKYDEEVLGKNYINERKALQGLRNVIDTVKAKSEQANTRPLVLAYDATKEEADDLESKKMPAEDSEKASRHDHTESETIVSDVQDNKTEYGSKGPNYNLGGTIFFSPPANESDSKQKQGEIPMERIGNSKK